MEKMSDQEIEKFLGDISCLIDIIQDRYPEAVFVFSVYPGVNDNGIYTCSNVKLEDVESFMQRTKVIVKKSAKILSKEENLN